MRNLIRLCAAAIPALVLCLVISTNSASSSARAGFVGLAASDTPTVVSSVSGAGPMWGPMTFKATLTAAGAPLSGKSIAFTAGGADAGSATTDANGVATLSTTNAIQNYVPGVYNGAVGATFAGASDVAGEGDFAGSSGAGTLNVSKANQSILFSNLHDRTYGEPDFRAFAFSTSAGPLTFTSTGACTVIPINTIHLTGPGGCAVTASSAGNNNFNPASTTVSFLIAKAFSTTTVKTLSFPSDSGQGVSMVATVVAAANSKPATPTGSVQCKIDGVTAGTASLAVNGVAFFPAVELPAGAHTFACDYSGDDKFGVSSDTVSADSVIEFTQASYSAAEGTALNVTVRRTGNTSKEVSVDYLTYDGSSPAVTTPCSDTTGAARDRCDFNRARGTFHFAAGESEKTFQILVADDSYTEGTETAQIRLDNGSNGAVFGPNGLATLSITDDSPESSGNPSDDSTKFVTQNYRDFLNREPDAAGLAFWVNEIESCGANAQCREVKRVNVSAAFFLSIEAQETSYIVHRTYKTAFGDTTSPNVSGTVPIVRLDEFLADSREIGADVRVGIGNWQDQLEANKVAYFQDFVTRARFANTVQSFLTPAQFVDALFANAGVTPTDAQRQAAIDEFGGAVDTSNTTARARSLRRVVENPTLNQREFNRAFVLFEYYGYLRRNPDESPEPTLNFGGWKFWLTKLEEFNGNFVKAEMVKAFITSDEYRHRFGQ